jgi:hypothetical protein
MSGSPARQAMIACPPLRMRISINF